MYINQVNPLNVSPVSLVLFLFVLTFSCSTINVESKFLNENITVVCNLLNLSLTFHIFNESVEQIAVDNYKLSCLEIIMESRPRESLVNIQFTLKYD